jgi:hypothetical protein
VANISREIADIELAVRGEEVRDSIVNALSKMNGEMNYINPLFVIVEDAVQDSTVYDNGWTYGVSCSGVYASTFAIPCLLSLEDYIGRYAVESVTDGFRLHFDNKPPDGLRMVIYYFSDGEYSDGEAERY